MSYQSATMLDESYERRLRKTAMPDIRQFLHVSSLYGRNADSGFVMYSSKNTRLRPLCQNESFSNEQLSVLFPYFMEILQNNVPFCDDSAGYKKTFYFNLLWWQSTK